MTQEIMKGFADAWSDKNVSAVMSYFTKDCEYRPSIYERNKECLKGKEQVEKAIMEIMQFDDSVQSVVYNGHIDKDIGFWEWEYVTAKGTVIKGCDFFRFKNNLIKTKNAYRKQIKS
ncbi:nuclear transport factor 2 family protein [Maribacter aestuarii]|uniref:nuclear transport factor 2 family protein n=1 Tax=Maribacter aestuarii TaxID=1130723 RepID=UPI00248D2B61|nr:nuclear transport factor 2 family protein [Maribacter aestuarii]